MPRRKLNIPCVQSGRPQTAPRQTWKKTIIANGLRDIPDGCIVDVTPAPGRTYTRHTWPPRGRGRGESLDSPRRIAAKLRGCEVVRMRIQGQCTWKQIANTLGFADPSGAYRAYHRMMDRIDWDRDRREELAGGDERRQLIEQVRALDDEELTG